MRAGGLMVVAAAAVAAVLLNPAPAAAQGVNSPADVQWAQDTLKSKGYDLGGRVSAKWTDGAKRALAAFQRANGLPATGELDAATMGKLSAVRSASPTVGTLGAPAQSNAAAAARREAPPQPKAVPTSRVGSEGGESGVIGGVVLGHAPPPAAAVGGAQPHAVPTLPVQAHENAPPPIAAPRAQVTGADGAPAGGALAADAGFQAANWMRYGVGGVLAVTLLAMTAGWWRSGRRKAPLAGETSFDDDQRPARARLEPSFGGRNDAKSGLPPLTAPARPRL